MGLFSYLFSRLAFRFGSFFRHWYVGGSRRYAHAALNFFELMDRGFALKITLRHLFKPMYGDYSAVGYALGFIFRSIRLVIGLVVYIISAGCWILIYGVLVAFPILFIISPFFIL
jgi:hypothetical protein